MPTVLLTLDDKDQDFRGAGERRFDIQELVCSSTERLADELRDLPRRVLAEVEDGDCHLSAAERNPLGTQRGVKPVV